MTVSDAISAALVLLSAAVAYGGFCRITHMSETKTLPAVRRAFTLVTICSVANIFAVLFWGYRPEWPALLLPAAYVAVLRVSARMWSDGQPQEYRR